MKFRLFALLPAVLLLEACSSFTTPRYSISADTNVALKASGAAAVGVGAFAEPASFSPTCRAAGTLAAPDGMTHSAYIRKALEDEFKVAGVHDGVAPRRVLSGTVNRLAFSSSRAVTGGSWDIDLTVNSSNGKSLNVVEYYEFDSGFVADTACKQTAEAFFPAVQNLMLKLVRSPGFKPLLD